MKKIAIILITFYQNFISPTLKLLLGIRSFCRYPVSCSQYAKEKIQEDGVLKGGGVALKRVLSCSPLSRYEYS